MLLARRHIVRRVNFCGGDVAYSGKEPAWNYAGASSDLAFWYSDVLSTGDFSDVLMFGDCRAIHRPVHVVAQSLGVRVHVFEEGYVRPNWITLEPFGVNGRSMLPLDPTWYRERRETNPPGQPTGYSLQIRAWHDIHYRMANALHAWRFPNYRSHRPYNGFVEYAGLANRFARLSRYKAEARRVASALVTERRPYYLFPLQLNSDSQIIEHSPFSGIREVISKVLHSFADHAPSDALLVVKNHPLDTGLIGSHRQVRSLAGQLGMADRVRYIEAGHLPTLLERARGVVVVNSTVGLSALHHDRPLMTLGAAVYSMPGMTWQGSLDDFWQRAESPDAALYQAFIDYVIRHTQINGDFYSRSGIAMAAAGAVSRLEAATSPFAVGQTSLSSESSILPQQHMLPPQLKEAARG